MLACTVKAMCDKTIPGWESNTIEYRRKKASSKIQKVKFKVKRNFDKSR